MNALTVTQAKGKLGRLVDDALKAKPVFIRRGSHVVQLVPAVMPEAIPIPEGGLTMSEERVAFINSTPEAIPQRLHWRRSR
jgi:hypothetical protein